MTKAKIIIIDDEPDQLDMLKMLLQLEDYEVITALDGEEGLNKIREHAPDLIICDIIMPKRDGYEVLRAVRKEQSRWIPFIMLSAVTDFEKIKQAHQEETDFYITKPVEKWVLSKNIKSLLNLSKQREQ